MHPNISSFPNTKFYQNRINDSQIVKSDTYKKCYIPGPFYGTYSFLNISCGREVLSDHNSWKNVVEIVVLLKILQLLHKGTYMLGTSVSSCLAFSVYVYIVKCP